VHGGPKKSRVSAQELSIMTYWAILLVHCCVFHQIGTGMARYDLVGSAQGSGSTDSGSFPVWPGTYLCFTIDCQIWITKLRQHIHNVTFSMRDTSAGRNPLMTHPGKRWVKDLVQTNFCKPRTMVSIPAGYLHDPYPDQDTCRVVRVPARYPYDLDIG